jgi:hypothetical protein
VNQADGAIPVISKLFEGWNQIIKIFATFKVLPKKWIVERTFSWIDTNRNSKSYVRLNNTSVIPPIPQLVVSSGITRIFNQAVPVKYYAATGQILRVLYAVDSMFIRISYF